MIAFSLEDKFGKMLPFDPKYVRWFATTWEYRGTGHLTYYPLHPCTEEEFEKFYSAKDQQTANEVANYQESGNLFCLHPKILEFNMWGSEMKGSEYNVIDIQLAPCATQIELFDGSLWGGEEQCVWKQQDMENYLNNAFFLKIYRNQQAFVQEEYDHGRIERYAELTKVWTITETASWTQGFIKQNQLTDETDFLQLGQFETEEFTTIEFGRISGSQQNQWPTKESPRKYKFNSIWLELMQQ